MQDKLSCDHSEYLTDHLWVFHPNVYRHLKTRSPAPQEKTSSEHRVHTDQWHSMVCCQRWFCQSNSSHAEIGGSDLLWRCGCLSSAICLMSTGTRRSKQINITAEKYTVLHEVLEHIVTQWLITCGWCYVSHHYISAFHWLFPFVLL